MAKKSFNSEIKCISTFEWPTRSQLAQCTSTTSNEAPLRHLWTPDILSTVRKQGYCLQRTRCKLREAAGSLVGNWVKADLVPTCMIRELDSVHCVHFDVQLLQSIHCALIPDVSVDNLSDVNSNKSDNLIRETELTALVDLAFNPGVDRAYFLWSPFYNLVGPGLPITCAQYAQ